MSKARKVFEVLGIVFIFSAPIWGPALVEFILK